MAPLENTVLTEEQYLDIERHAEFKSEFHDGQMFAMAGGSPNDAVLTAKIIELFGRQVPARCRVFSPDLRIKAAAVRLYTYADCTVICGDLEYFGDQKDVIVNPLLIVEVLSPSTENYDRGKKFELYRTIGSFREYLMVHQDRRYVEHYSKQDDGSWLLREYSDESASVAIARIGAQISLAELYASAIDITS